MPSQYCGMAAVRTSSPDPIEEMIRPRRTVRTDQTTASTQASSSDPSVSSAVGPTFSAMTLATDCCCEAE